MAKVKLTNSVQIDSTSLIYGIDTSNILATFSDSANLNWTATGDCWICISMYSYDGQIKVDDKIVALQTGQLKAPNLIFPMRKGQKLTSTGKIEVNYNVVKCAYGMK